VKRYDGAVARGLRLAARSVVVVALAGAAGWAAAPEGPLRAPARPWRTAASGLEVGRLLAPTPSAVGDSIVTVVRVDPGQFELRLLSAKLLGLTSNPTAQQWVEQHGVIGAINASMFRTDGVTSVAYMRDRERTNNGRWTKDNAVFVSRPRRTGLPAAQILDRACGGADALASLYDVVVQNIRMLDCQRHNTWSQQPRRWSTACVGEDGTGRILFVHVRSPYTTHDLVDALLALPLDLKRLMYVEGGPEASLFVKIGGKVVVAETGSYETGFNENDGNRLFWPLPNVLAIAERPH
jgi:hypothetical protein